ncbi:MAG: hypothetical protein K2I67_01600 [Malacoplasma sp.]|nr:hypothetical protein [Malacoplasma sp.]
MKFFILNADPYQDPGNYPYSGSPSWIYYLFGAIFVVLAILSAWYTWKVRHSKEEYSHLMDTFGEFKRFWITHRFTIMILITVILIACSIVFFTMNDTLAVQSS